MTAKDAAKQARDATSAAAGAARGATSAAAGAARGTTNVAAGAAKDASDKFRDLGSFIREQRKGAQLSLRNLASLAGVSNPYLSQIERGLRKPSAEILQQIAKALRISAETLYVKAGILEEQGDDLPTRILADPHLTEKQKRALLEIYLAFRADEGGGDAADTVLSAVADDDAPTASAEASGR